MTSSVPKFMDWIKPFGESDNNVANLNSFNGKPTPGKWFIPKDKVEAFFSIFIASGQYMKEYHFVEQWDKTKEIRKVVFDFDLKDGQFKGPLTPEFLDKLKSLLIIKTGVQFQTMVVKRMADDSYHVILPQVGATFQQMKWLAKSIRDEFGMGEKQVDDSIYSTRMFNGKEYPARGIRMLFCTKDSGSDDPANGIIQSQRKAMILGFDYSKKPSVDKLVVQLKLCSIMWPTFIYTVTDSIDMPLLETQEEMDDSVDEPVDNSVHESAEEIQEETQDPMPQTPTAYQQLETPPQSPMTVEETPVPGALSEDLKKVIYRLISKMNVLPEDVHSIQKISSDSYKVRIQSTYCNIAKANHGNKDGRCIMVQPRKLIYTCLAAACESNKPTLSWKPSEEEREYFEKPKSKKRKEKRGEPNEDASEELNPDLDDEDSQRTKKKKKKGPSGYELLLRSLSSSFIAGKYARRGENIYEPIIENGFYTGAYSKKSTILAWVKDQCVSTNTFNFSLIMNNSTLIQKTSEYIQGCSEKEITFPILKVNHLFRSFKDYQWDMENELWIEHGPIQHKEISVMWHDCFVRDLIDQPVHLLEIPVFTKIFKTQKYSDESIDCVLFMTGRLMAPLNKFDNLQCTHFIYGYSGSGKSIYFTALKCFWNVQPRWRGRLV